MSKLRQTESGLIVPVEEEDPTKRPPKRIELFSITTLYTAEAEKFIHAILKGGGSYIGCLLVDRYNYWGEINGKHYLHLYHAEEEISIERWT